MAASVPCQKNPRTIEQSNLVLAKMTFDWADDVEECIEKGELPDFVPKNDASNKAMTAHIESNDPGPASPTQHEMSLTKPDLNNALGVAEPAQKKTLKSPTKNGPMWTTKASWRASTEQPIPASEPINSLTTTAPGSQDHTPETESSTIVVESSSDSEGSSTSSDPTSSTHAGTTISEGPSTPSDTSSSSDASTTTLYFESYDSSQEVSDGETTDDSSIQDENTEEMVRRMLTQSLLAPDRCYDSAIDAMLNV
ncbi:hypothetical protein L207DRAFT_528187 [Hyaloscypha variabilis F]|uniref:Uncharacterized protein n=1 Tax=Hyaloscypha variabilis (strain UAMH 11265 / GT02V1 / F) TaxID=1149755 RepID=A0A2J6RST6_HYAVF|nr:hypothetical protein L207DRAFT_528187 [Hyaloscypha variabilis F]